MKSNCMLKNSGLIPSQMFPLSCYQNHREKSFHKQESVTLAEPSRRVFLFFDLDQTITRLVRQLQLLCQA